MRARQISNVRPCSATRPTIHLGPLIPHLSITAFSTCQGGGRPLAWPARLLRHEFLFNVRTTWQSNPPGNWGAGGRGVPRPVRRTDIIREIRLWKMVQILSLSTVRGEFLSRPPTTSSVGPDRQADVQADRSFRVLFYQTPVVGRKWAELRGPPDRGWLTPQSVRPLSGPRSRTPGVRTMPVGCRTLLPALMVDPEDEGLVPAGSCFGSASRPRRPRGEVGETASWVCPKDAKENGDTGFSGSTARPLGRHCLTRIPACPVGRPRRGALGGPGASRPWARRDSRL